MGYIGAQANVRNPSPYTIVASAKLEYLSQILVTATLSSSNIGFQSNTVLQYRNGTSCSVAFFSSFFGQSGGAYWWRVCYQRGQPRLVYLEFSINIVSSVIRKIIQLHLLVSSLADAARDGRRWSKLCFSLNQPFGQSSLSVRIPHKGDKESLDRCRHRDSMKESTSGKIL